MYYELTEYQEEILNKAHDDFPNQSYVRYLPINGVFGTVVDVYWNHLFHEPWLEVVAHDSAYPKDTEHVRLPALLFLHYGDKYAEEEASNTDKESANT